VPRPTLISRLIKAPWIRVYPQLGELMWIQIHILYHIRPHTRGVLSRQKHFSSACREGRLACQQFEVFAKYGGRRWRKEARDPSAAIYARVFRGSEQVAALCS
jgi:hypothetical protein